MNNAHAACNSCECCPHFCWNRASHQLCTDSFPLFVFMLAFSLALFTDAHLAHVRSENQNKLTLLALMRSTKALPQTKSVCRVRKYIIFLSVALTCSFLYFYLQNAFKFKTHYMSTPHLLWGEPRLAKLLYIFQSARPKKGVRIWFLRRAVRSLDAEFVWDRPASVNFPSFFFLLSCSRSRVFVLKWKGNVEWFLGKREMRTTLFRTRNFNFAAGCGSPRQVNREFKMKPCDMWAEFSNFKSEIIYTRSL